MSLTEGLLILIVICLVYVMVRKSKPRAGKIRAWDCIDRDSGDVTSVKMKYVGSGAGSGAGSDASSDAANPEGMAASSNLEYFAGCTSSVDKGVLDIMCSGDDFAYAVNDFGGPGMDYKDWVASQAVDPAVLKNHAEFVQDRLENQQQWATSTAYSPDSHDSYDPIPWQGIRGRPQAVAMCNPTQVPDVDVNLYDKCQKVTWASSGSC